jgi:hypothetical protein
MVVGIDPGYRNTGVTLVDGRRVVHAFTVRGKGPAAPFAAVAAGAHAIAEDVVSGIAVELAGRDATLELVAIEGWQFMGPGRAAQGVTTAQVFQAIYSAVRVRFGEGTSIRVQFSGDVLDPKSGYGRLKAMLTNARAVQTCEWRLNDHEAAAACHALWADARDRQWALL